MHLAYVATWLGLARAADPADVPAPEPPPPVVRVEIAVAWHAARSSALLGASSAAATGMTARRVIADGQEWTSTAVLVATSDNDDAQVSSPYMVSGLRSTRVIATDLVEQLAARGLAEQRLLLGGRALDIDGVTYVVLTSFQPVAP